jgi:hypothetical protein
MTRLYCDVKSLSKLGWCIMICFSLMLLIFIVNSSFMCNKIIFHYFIYIDLINHFMYICWYTCFNKNTHLYGYKVIYWDISFNIPFMSICWYMCFNKNTHLYWCKVIYWDTCFHVIYMCVFFNKNTQSYLFRHFFSYFFSIVI